MAWQHAFSQVSTHKNFDDKRLLDDIKTDIINL